MLGQIWRIDWPLMRQLVAIGAPISLSFMLEYGLFSAAALLMGLISTTALAAHQVALQVTAVLFMVPYGIARRRRCGSGTRSAASMRAAVKRAGLVALLLGIALDGQLYAAGDRSAGLRSGGCSSAAPTTPMRRVMLTATLLLVGATFFIGDGVQTIALGSLRGMNDTRVPLLFAVIGYWLIGFPTACVLGFWAGLGAIGVWIGLSCGTAVYATLLVLRFRLLARRFGTS